MKSITDFRRLVAFVPLIVTIACGAPTPPVNSPAVPTVKSIAIIGTAALNGIGRTSALTATATLSDSTTTNVTSSATWSSSSTAASVSSAGVVTAVGVGSSTVTASYFGVSGTLAVTVTNTPKGPGNAHRMIAWASYEKLILFTDAQLDMWKSRGVDGFVIQTRYLDEMGGIEMWTENANDPLDRTLVEGADVHERQRALRDTKFAERFHARGMKVYLGFYLSNYHNLATPLKVWNDDAGWASIIPTVRGIAGAAKNLGMDGLATDSENYHTEDQTWNWNYPGVNQQTETMVRDLAKKRGRAFMDAVLAGFPNVEIINYRLEVPGDWEEYVQLKVNGVNGVWDKSVFPDFWGGIVDAGGFSAIQFFDPIFYKSWQYGQGGWDAALEYNVNGVRSTLSKRWANWDYAATRFFISPFAWIDPGPSAGSFDDARPVDYVAAQLAAFHKWGEGNTFGLYTQHIDDFDYTPYVPAMQAASTPDAGTSAAQRTAGPGDDRPGRDRFVVARDVAAAVQPMRVTLPSGAAKLELVTTGLHEPTDAAVAPDGRLFITERKGRIRVIRDGKLNPNPALTLDDVRAQGTSGLLATAIDPDFERTHFVYVIYTAESRAGESVFRLARFREAQDTLGDRAVLLDSVPAAVGAAAAALRFGPDGRLYAAFDAGADPNRAGNPGSYNGKILRLNADGSTPSDRVSFTPITADGYSVPAGIDWQPGSRTLWAAGRDARNVGGLRIVGQSDAAVINASAMAFYGGGPLKSLRGNLLVARGDTPTITRIEFDAAHPDRILRTEPILANVPGVIRMLVVGKDGAIYFSVGNDLMRVIAR